MTANQQTLDLIPNIDVLFRNENNYSVLSTNYSKQNLAKLKIPRKIKSQDSFQDWWRNYLDCSVNPFVPKINKKVSFIDLFSSVGGLSLAFQLAAESVGLSAESKLAVDLDKEALHVYKSNFEPSSLIHSSVSDLIDYKIIGKGADAEFVYKPELISKNLLALINQIDVVLAGPPCQGHSTLNNHSRSDDPRNYLYLTVPSIAIALNAKALVIENVPNVINDRKGVVESTKKLLRSNGYSISFATLAADQLGWAQTRKRYFLVATRETEPFDLNILSEQNYRVSAPISWLLNNFKASPIDDEIMYSDPQMSLENQQRISWLFENNLFELPNHQRPDCHKDGNTYPSVYGRMRWDKPAPTLTTGFGSPGRGRYIHPLERRVLRPREAARIQGFPNWFNFNPHSIKEVKRTMLGKWIGDAVPSQLGFLPCLSVLRSLI